MSDYSVKSKEELALLERAEMGDIDSQTLLLMYYWDGSDDPDIAVNKSEALKWKRRLVYSAAAGNILAMGAIGGAVKAPIDSPFFYGAELSEKYRKIVIAESEAGNAKAMLAVYCDIVDPKSDGFKYLLRSAELGCEESYYVLMKAFGMAAIEKRTGYALYDYGVPVEDFSDLLAEEIKWAKKGATSNTPRASDCQMRLSQYYNEIGDAENRDKYLKMAMANSNAIKQQVNGYNTVMSGTTEKKSGCYIATAVYGSYSAPQVLVLRRFRDDTLAKSLPGRLFIKLYYLLSPPVAEWLKNTQRINTAARNLLDNFVARLDEK